MSLVSKSNVTRGAIGLIIFSVLLIIFVPWFAKTKSYALPGKGGLLCRFSFGNRRYLGPRECSGDFAYGVKVPCDSESKLVDEHWWPLTKIGEIPTLLGSPYPVLVDVRSSKSANTPTVLFLRTEDNCYVGYGLSGGP